MPSLLGFLMNCMLAAERAVLLVLHTGRVKTLVLVAIIVTLMANSAFKRNKFSWHFYSLLDDFGYGSGADGAAALADGEAELLLHGDRGDELHVDRHVVARRHHLHAFRELDRASHVRRAEVELRAVAVHERRVAAALLLLQNVDLALEVSVRGDGLRSRENHPADDVLLLRAAEQEAHVVASLRVVEQLAEHLHARHHVFRRVAEAHALHLVVQADDAALDTPGRDGAAARDGEHVLDRHQERLVRLADGLRDVLVNGLHQLHDLVLVRRVALERLQRGAADDRRVVAVVAVLLQQVADLLLDELEEFRVVHHVTLVQEHDDLGDAHLVREEDVLAGLRHRAVGRRDDEDRAVHLGRARHHVLHVVGVPRAVDVRVVAVLRLVFHVRRVDRDAARLLFRRVVDLVELLRRREALRGQGRADGSRQRRLAVVDVADRADVAVRLGSFKMLFCHFILFFTRRFIASNPRMDFHPDIRKA